MSKLGLGVGLSLWAGVAGYVYILWRLWTATLEATNILPGVANLALFVILLFIGLGAIPAGLVLGLMAMAD